MNGNNWFLSSWNPTQLSLTIKGLLIGIIPLIVIAFKFYGMEIGEGELKIIADNVEGLIVAIGGIISAFMILWGLVRKIIVRFSK